VCDKCYKFGRCFEQRGICSEYRNIEDIRAEIEAVMQSAKIAGDKTFEDGRVSVDPADAGLIEYGSPDACSIEDHRSGRKGC